MFVGVNRAYDRHKKFFFLLIFLTQLALSFFTIPSAAKFVDTGWDIDGRYIDEPDFLFPNSKLGSYVQSLQYTVATIPADITELPKEFDKLIDTVKMFVDTGSEQQDKRSQFYVGPNGVLNGEGFDFQRKNLPTKIVRISYCFGFDPLLFMSLIRQESHFKKSVKSHRHASGFTQLTGAAIMEASEQLGILDSVDTRFRGDEAPEIFAAYIHCYLGPNKWVNMWEDGTIPAGKEAYVGGNIYGKGKKSRKWAYSRQSKNWLDLDPNRNLIYGAVYFKLMLGKGEKLGWKDDYAGALSKYNVGQGKHYVYSVFKHYKKALKIGGFETVNYNLVKFNPPGLNCLIPAETWHKNLYLLELTYDIYGEDAVTGVIDTFKKDGYCRPNEIEV